MADRWSTGWVLLPDQRATNGDPVAHRPDPDDPAAVMCRDVVPPDNPVQDSFPADVRVCNACAAAIGEARKRVRKARRSRPPLPPSGRPGPIPQPRAPLAGRPTEGSRPRS